MSTHYVIIIGIDPEIIVSLKGRSFMLEATFPSFESISHAKENEENQAKSCGNDSDKCSHWNWIKNLKKKGKLMIYYFLSPPMISKSMNLE